ncbi:MAG: c-type cytochrome, partial [Pirellula staleyi]
MQSPSSAIAETARQQLIWRYQDNPEHEKNTVSEIRTLASQAEEAVVRLRAVAVLLALGKCETQDWKAVCKDSDERVVRWAVETLTKQRLVQGELRDSLINVSHSDMARQSAALALQLIVALATCAEPAYDALSPLLVQHAGERWIDTSVILLPSSGIDSVIEHLLANANIRTVGMIDQLVSNASPKLKQQLRDRIASGSDLRPAWHFTLSRQFALEEDKAIRLDETTVEKLQRDSLAIVQNDRADPNLRRAALSWFMSRLGSNDQPGIASLVSVLTRANENDFREPLVKALVSLGGPGLKPIFEKWSSLDQETRATTISGCLASEPTTSTLLGQLTAGGIGVDSFQPAQIEQLRGRKSQELRAMVEKHFGPPPGADRVAIVQEYTSKWPTTFDASRGQALYKQHCAQCHQDRVEASGVLPAVGPNLQALAGWKNDAWLTAIFDPNK